MNIVLQNSLIFIKTDFDTLNLPWMMEFLNQHTRGMLFLPKAVLIFKNESLIEVKEKFLHSLSDYYASTHDLSHSFFLRSMLKYRSQPIRIELTDIQEAKPVEVKLYAYDKATVLLTLDKPNSWVLSYFRSQLEVYVERGTDSSLVIDIEDFKAKTRLDRVLNKKDILHYKISYSYDNHFLSTIYSDYATFSFGDLCKRETVCENRLFYTVLECPVGASQSEIKKSYKKLTKVYHPDKLHNEKPHMVEHYTSKFQQLQEAYTALKS